MKCENNTVTHVLARGERDVMLNAILALFTRLLFFRSGEEIKIFVMWTVAFALMFIIQMRLCFGTRRRRIKLIPIWILLEEWIFLLLCCICPVIYLGGWIYIGLVIRILVGFCGFSTFACTAASLLAWGIYGIYLLIGTCCRRRAERKMQNTAETSSGHETVVPGAERIN